MATSINVQAIQFYQRLSCASTGGSEAYRTDPALPNLEILRILT